MEIYILRCRKKKEKKEKKEKRKQRSVLPISPLDLPRSCNHSRRRLIWKTVAGKLHRILELISRNERIVALRRTHWSIPRLAQVVILGDGVRRRV